MTLAAAEFGAGGLTVDLSQAITHEFRHVRRLDAVELNRWIESGIGRMEQLSLRFAPRVVSDRDRDRGQQECLLVYTNIADAIIACSDPVAAKAALTLLESVSLAVATNLEASGSNTEALGVLRELNRVRGELAPEQSLDSLQPGLDALSMPGNGPAPKQQS